MYAIRSYYGIKCDVDRITEELNKGSEIARSTNDALLRRAQKQALEVQIEIVAAEVSILEQDASVLSDATIVRQRLADKERELAYLRAQFKREYPETETRWWNALFFWWKS